MTIASAVTIPNDSKVISSVGSGTVWKWSKAQRDSKPSRSACAASSTVRAQAAAGSQPSYSPFQPCGIISPTFIVTSSTASVAGLRASTHVALDGPSPVRRGAPSPLIAAMTPEPAQPTGPTSTRERPLAGPPDPWHWRRAAGRPGRSALVS